MRQSRSHDSRGLYVIHDIHGIHGLYLVETGKGKPAPDDIKIDDWN